MTHGGISRASMVTLSSTKRTWPYCELCGRPVDAGGLGRYTSKGKRRRFCSRDCRNTANSRAGAPIRSEKALGRVASGEWQNPAEVMTRDQLRKAARLGGGARAKQHRAALEAGTWQSPADAPGARAKLSRPRVHSDNPTLHRAIEKLRGGSMADLTEAEANEYRVYRQQLRDAKRARGKEGENPSVGVTGWASPHRSPRGSRENL